VTAEQRQRIASLEEAAQRLVDAADRNRDALRAAVASSYEPVRPRAPGGDRRAPRGPRGDVGAGARGRVARRTPRGRERLVKVLTAAERAERRQRYLARRAKRAARRSPAPARPKAETREALVRRELQEARGELGRATTRATAWAGRVGRLERAIAELRRGS
jgi:hypothetical protein